MLKEITLLKEINGFLPLRRKRRFSFKPRSSCVGGKIKPATASLLPTKIFHSKNEISQRRI